MAAVEEDPPPKPRFSPEEVLKQLEDVPEDNRTFSSTSFLQALTSQRETWTAIKALKQNEENATLADFDRVILFFLKNIYNLVSGLPGALMFDAMEDLMANSGILTPFVRRMVKIDESVALELGLPSKDDALCDNQQELIRVAATAIVCFYHYTNYPAHPDVFPSDDATLLFTSLALDSCRDRAASETLSAQLAEQGAGVMSLGEIRWLMHYIRGQLLGLTGAVFLGLGDKEKHKQHLLAQQADFLGLIKAVPENPAGYGYYVRTCLQFQQLSAAGLFAAKGAVVAAKHNSPFYGAQLAAQRAIVLAFAGGGTSSTGSTSGEVSMAAKAAAVRLGAAAAEPAPAESVSLFRAGELRALVTQAREGLGKERAGLPEVYGDLVVLDPVDSKLLDERFGPMLQDVPDEGEILALTDLLYPTLAPTALPRGAVAIAKP
ncbi:hypothetical protein Vretimale_6749 [Volvox reticuliferus]|uniref:Uncharacterized protein n=1 Tax=Volvox reticuliferus TaxID=1737510 RepID=A0A8J4LM25_9CHLO|nr:hypothetical protein Vretifemale_7194 [Volvox reticuliferus]GIM01983.1 hypothetical protein Vretimale_6749 [Volvox reticuliferus]